MTVTKVESVLGVDFFEDFKGLLVFLLKIDPSFEIYLRQFEETEEEYQDDCRVELMFTLRHEKTLVYKDVEFRIFKCPHDTDAGELIFGFVVSHVESYDGGSSQGLQHVLRKAEVLKELIGDDEDLTPAFYTINDSCFCCT